jgi:hypothetical protein
MTTNSFKWEKAIVICSRSDMRLCFPYPVSGGSEGMPLNKHSIWGDSGFLPKSFCLAGWIFAGDLLQYVT